CYRSRILLPRRAAPAPSRRLCILLSVLFFFNDPAPPEISTLSLHDALPIWQSDVRPCRRGWEGRAKVGGRQAACARESDGIVLIAAASQAGQHGSHCAEVIRAINGASLRSARSRRVASGAALDRSTRQVDNVSPPSAT